MNTFFYPYKKVITVSLFTLYNIPPKKQNKYSVLLSFVKHYSEIEREEVKSVIIPSHLYWSETKFENTAEAS